MLFGTFQSQFLQIWLFLKEFGTENFEIYVLFGSKIRKILFTVWLSKFWDLVNKLRNLALFIWKFGTEALPVPNITDPDNNSIELQHTSQSILMHGID